MTSQAAGGRKPVFSRYMCGEPFLTFICVERVKIMKITITHLETGTRELDTALYTHYSGQTSPQNAHIALDGDEGTVWADVNYEIGNAVPSNVWHGRILRWTIPALHAEAANGLMDELEPLLQRVQDGYTCEWDGNNMRGVLTQDAIDADDEITAITSDQYYPEVGMIQAGEAGDWFSNYADWDIETDTPDKHLDQLAGEAWGEGFVIDDIAGYLYNIRDNM